MRTTIRSLLLGGVVCTASLVLQSSCQSSDVTQATDAAVPDPGNDGGTADLAGSAGSTDLAGSSADLAKGGNPDLFGSVNPEADPKLAGITALHNQARAAVNPKPAVAVPQLTWDTTVAAAAQLVANTCVFQHSNNGYGENIYASAGQLPTPAAVVGSWTSEAANYNYSANSCASTCGHYTQVVWRTSQKLGCAQQTCTKNSPFPGFTTWYFVVCDYNPPGNSGTRPY
jgi:uncharacterized protein YkwD